MKQVTFYKAALLFLAPALFGKNDIYIVNLSEEIVLIATIQSNAPYSIKLPPKTYYKVNESEQASEIIIPLLSRRLIITPDTIKKLDEDLFIKVQLEKTSTDQGFWSKLRKLIFGEKSSISERHTITPIDEASPNHVKMEILLKNLTRIQ